MRKTHLAFAIVLLIATSNTLIGQTAPRYELPPKEVIAAFDATPLPQAILSPSKQTLALPRTFTRACRPSGTRTRSKIRSC